MGMKASAFSDARGALCSTRCQPSAAESCSPTATHDSSTRPVPQGHSGDLRVYPVYGCWLPHNRLSHDQVGANLRAGLQNTYDEKGAKRVWIAGGKADDGKRFCTFNITTRAVGIKGKPRRGQPKMSVT